MVGDYCPFFNKFGFEEKGFEMICKCFEIMILINKLVKLDELKKIRIS
jgi:hypothetical protein